MEHSERAVYVTHQVATWIINDGLYYMTALKMARMGTKALASFCTRTIEAARHGEAAWHVRQELAPNDYARIRWEDVAAELLSE